MTRDAASRLRGQTAIVTGGGWNIGRAVARAFAAEGARVAVASRQRASLEQTVRLIEEAGGTALAVPTDVTDLSQVEALVRTTVERWGTLDVMAALAGGGSTNQPVDVVDPGAWEEVVRVNLLGTFHCAHTALPFFRRQNHGSILTCSGGGAYFPVLGQHCTAYACAKAAVCRFTDQLTAELLDTSIRVNCLDPGRVPAGASADGAGDGAEQAEAEGTPARAAERAAELAVWLVSAASEPLRGRLVSVHDNWWRDPDATARVDASLLAYRLRRSE